MTAASRWRASLARSRSADSIWSVTSAPKTRTPLCGATQATSGSGPAAGGDLDRGAGEGVVAVAGAVAAGDLAGLDRARFAAAQDLVHQGEQAECGELGEGFAGGAAGRARAEDGGVGTVHIGEAVLGAVDDGDQGRDGAQDVVDGQGVHGGRQGRGGAVLGGGRIGVFGAGRGDRAGGGGRRGGRCAVGCRGHGGRRRSRGGRDGRRAGCGAVGPGGGAPLCAGEFGAPAREDHGGVPLTSRRRAGSGRRHGGISRQVAGGRSAGGTLGALLRNAANVQNPRDCHSLQIRAHPWSHVQCGRPDGHPSDAGVALWSSALRNIRPLQG